MIDAQSRTPTISYEEAEPLEVVAASVERLAHVHVSDSDRNAPGRGLYDFQGFFDCLKRGGCRGRLSVDMMTEVTDDEMRRSLKLVRNLWS